MEQTTLQQRIEERAEERLLKDLWDAAQQERNVSDFIGHKLYPCKLDMLIRYRRSTGDEYQMNNDYTKSIFAEKLPTYISRVTDEILQKIDEIDYLVQSNKELQEDLP